MAMYINHSCEPNCETDQVDGRIWINAMLNIKAGEELTYDYNLFDGEGEAPCSCGARKCRGTMYSWDEIRKLKKEARKKALKEKKAARKKTAQERKLARRHAVAAKKAARKDALRQKRMWEKQRRATTNGKRAQAA